MNVNKAEFIISAVDRSQYPKDLKPEIAFVGRSNVGKSSCINVLTNRKKLARVSQEPGKTRLINFFNIENKLYFVDLPGYGFAKVAKTEKEKWGKMIEKYLTGRTQLKAIVHIVDIRHEPTNDDIAMNEWIKFYGYNCIVVCTKADKISKTAAENSIAKIKEILELGENDRILPFSSLKKSGKDELWLEMEKMIEL